MPKEAREIGRFVHCADLHLGYKQYGLEKRAKDFLEVFEYIAEYTIGNGIKLLLIAGDLFHKKDIKPETLIYFQRVLIRLKNAGVDVVVVEGNHDSKHTINKMSWIEYLEQQSHLRYVSHAIGSIVTGDWYTVVGMPYSGAVTDKALEKIEEGVKKDIEANLHRSEVNILMLHAGVLGQIPNTGNISATDLLRFRNYFDYIALGHIHKPYEIEDIIYNPGSPEHCSLGESEFGGGVYDVTITTTGMNAELIQTSKRPMYRYVLNVDKKSPAKYPDINEETILEVEIVGECDGDVLKSVKEKIFEDFKDVFYLKLVDKTTREKQEIEFKGSSKAEIERNVINDMTQDQKMTDIIIDIKNSEELDPEMTFGRFLLYVTEKPETKKHQDA